MILWQYLISVFLNQKGKIFFYNLQAKHDGKKKDFSSKRHIIQRQIAI